MIKKTYFTPGPSELYFTVPDHLKSAMQQGIGSISHRGSQFKAFYQETIENLKELFQLPEGYHMVFLASATEAWERILQNLVVSHSTHVVNGSFSAKFHEFATLLGKETLKIESPWGSCPNFSDVKFESTELLSLTHNETSTGATLTENDLVYNRKLLKDTIIALDIVSSAPVYPLDLSTIDTCYFSVQKAFGLPAGLAVWIYNDKCLDKHEEIAKKQITGTYHRLAELHAMGQKNQTPETPNVLGIYLLNQITKDFLRKGQTTLWREAQYKSTLLYTTLESSGRFAPFVSNKANRSISTLVFKKLDNSDILTKLSEKGIVLGKGYGKYAEEHIRIANFPTHSKEQVELLCDLIEKI